MRNKILLLLLWPALLVSIQKSFGNCDTKNGPVVTAAKQALQTNNVNLVLSWIPEKDKGLIKDAFEKTITLRKINPDVQEAMDNYFFETLVRIHLAGEGVAYTGLKDGAEGTPVTEAGKPLDAHSVSIVPAMTSTLEYDFLKFILIVSGVLLIVIIPVLVSRRHAF